MSKVVVIKCENYDLDFIYNKIKWGIDQLGGITNIIPVEKNILIKPNLLIASKPEDAVTTHPVIFEAVAKILTENNYNVKYGDSPGIGNPQKVGNKSGIGAVASKYNIEFADFFKGKKVSFKEGMQCKQFDIANGVIETDCIISLPKMKAHALQRITGAVKNPFGCVIGFNKAAMHAKFTNAFDFAEMLIDLNNYLKVDLHIMDGIMAMEGNGPKNGTPTPMNVILISTDPVAIDTIFCKLINIDPLIIPTNTFGQKYDLGSIDNIELIGDDINPLINKEFKIDRNELRKEDFKGLKFFTKHALRRPYIDKKLCKSCGICIDVCPLKNETLKFKDNNKLSIPVYNYDTCIRCYCCQEMCPYHAIKVKTPLLGKILYGLRLIK